VNKTQLYNTARQRIAHAIAAVHIDEREVYQIATNFFVTFLELDYEATVGELLEELKKIYIEKTRQKRIEQFLKKIEYIEYSKRKYSEQELKALLKEMKELLQITIPNITVKSNWLQQWFINLKLTKATPTVLLYWSVALAQKITDIEQEKDTNKAKQNYSQALSVYKKLPSNEQQHYYEKIQALYNQLK